MSQQHEQLLQAWNVATRNWLAAKELQRALQVRDVPARDLETAREHVMAMATEMDRAEVVFYAAIKSERRVANG